MHDPQTSTRKTSNTGAAVLLGSVLGVIVGGTVVAGFCGWQLWAANLSAKVESTTRTVPAATFPPASASPYATPAAGYSVGGTSGNSQSGYGSYPATSGYSSGIQPASGNPGSSGTYGQPSYNPASPVPTDPKAPTASDTEQDDSDG